MKKIILGLGILVLLSSCDYDLPKVDAGYVCRLDGRTPGVKKELTFLQVSTLSEWFAAHREGWTHEIADVYPGKLVTFRWKGIDVVTVDFTGTQVWVGSRVRSLTPDEAKALERIIDGETGF